MHEESVSNSSDRETLTLQGLFDRSERIRKAMWGNHSALLSKLFTNEEKIDWIMDRLSRIENDIGR